MNDVRLDELSVSVSRFKKFISSAELWNFCPITDEAMLPRVVPSLTALRLCGLACRWASRDSSAWVRSRKAQQDPGSGKDLFMEDPNMVEPEEQLQALERKEKSRQKAIKLQRLRRQLTTPGPPERRLTWDAMEQIKYLRRELPEEWTVARLAEGFSVSHDDVHRVLRSHFVPSRERRQKQDATVSARLWPQSLLAGAHVHGRPGSAEAMLPGSAGSAKAMLPGSVKAMLPAGTGSVKAMLPGSTLTTLTHQSLGPGQHMATTAPPGGSGSTVSPPALPNHRSPVLSTENATPQARQSTVTQALEEEEEEEEGWDGIVLSDEELEELARTQTEQTYQVVQKGSEVFDNAGNFLYRI